MQNLFSFFIHITYLCNMQRINWMDWAKFLAVVSVIPIHIPQELGAQPITFFEVFILATLMFNSGYLKKVGRSWKGNLKQYWNKLIIPYFIYNIVFIPYWIVKFSSESGHLPSITDMTYPIMGIFTLQATTSFSCELNLVTWFIASLLLMHLILDFCLQFRLGHWFMGIICLLGVALYTLSKYNSFTTALVAVGTFKAIPFYYLGYLCRQNKVLDKCNLKKDIFWFAITFALSIITFYYHANESNFTWHMISYWPTVFFGVLTFAYFCKLLDSVHSQVVINYSNGTMAFIGLHWMIAGIIRYGILKPIFHVPADYVYSPTEAYLLALVVTLVLYPIILFFMKKAPWMLGRRTNAATGA